MYSCTRDNQNFHCPTSLRAPLMMENRWNKSQIESAPNCPRCASSNTKFCYYNNYSFSQPRYFCKGCRRYWTKGGSLRNVPVGGGCRKSRRSRTASARSSDQRSGLSNYGISHNIDPAATNGSSDSSTTDGVTIDLAAVFAKFLNQDSNNNNNNNASSSSSDDLIQTSYDVVENRVEYMFQSQIDTGLPEICVDVENSNTLDELQAILGDEEIVPWSSDIGWSNLSNIDGSVAVPQLEFQDFGLFDEAKMASQLAEEDDHWNSFDLSVYEIFTTP